MMKYGILFYLTLFCAFPLFAFIPGDTVVLPEKAVLAWSNCSPMPLAALSDREKEKLPPYRAVVFFRPRSENSAVTIAMLEQLHKQNSALLLIAAIAPDPLAEVKAIQKANPNYRIRMASDKEQKITHSFMAGTLLFPMAFLLDEEGEVLWRGEAVDLAEAFLNAKNGKLDRKVQRKIAPMISELLQQLRSGDDAAIQQATKRIFAVEPGNPTALRIQLFLLENKGKFSDAQLLIRRQIEKAPTLLRLYFTMLDLLRRHPELRDDLPQLADQFFEHASLPEEVISFARCLTDYFPDDADALTAAANLLAAVEKDLPPAITPLYLAARAQLAYRLCDLPQALQFQQRCVEASRKIGREDAAAEAEKRLLFYRKLENLQKRPVSAE